MTAKYYSTKEDIKTFLNQKFNNESTPNLSSIIDKLIEKDFAGKDFKNALFCTEYNKHWLELNWSEHSNIFIYTAIFYIITLNVALISIPFLSRSALNYLHEIVPYALAIIVGTLFLAIVADGISVYCQNNSRLDELNSFFKSQEVQDGSSNNSYGNSILDPNFQI